MQGRGNTIKMEMKCYGKNLATNEAHENQRIAMKGE
jgi:hypothetical protein